MPDTTPSDDALDREGRPARAAATPRRPTGTIPTDAASIPTVAARSGSPAVLSRTFQATCRTAETATRAMIQGSTPGRYLPRSRRCRPHAPIDQAADRQDDGDHDPDRVDDAGHRLAEVLEEGQLEDRRRAA